MVFCSLQLLFALLCLCWPGGGGSLVFPVELKAQRLAVVLPFTAKDSLDLLANLARWKAEGEPCPLLRRYEARHYVDFVVRQSRSQIVKPWLPFRTRMRSLGFADACRLSVLVQPGFYT